MDIYGALEKHIEFRKSFRNQPLVALSTAKKLPNIPHTYNLKKPLNHEHLKKLLAKIGKGSISSSTHTGNQKPENALPKKRHNAIEKKPVEKNSAPNFVPRKPSSASNQAGKLLGEEKTHQFVGTHDDIDTSNSTEVKNALYDPTHMLQGSIHEACKLAEEKNTTIELISFGIGIIIDPHAFKVYTVVSDSVLRPLCLLEDKKKRRFEELASYSDNVYTENSKPNAKLIEWDIDAFLWKISLWSSRGRVPKGTNFQSKVYLSQWPNLTRLEMIPHALQISALLTQKPRQLSKISKQLGLPQRYVFAFYSACKSLGIANECRRQSDHIFEEPPVRTERADRLESTTSIMKKIIFRLTRRNPSDQKHSA
ncbi:MAG: hypothetical protein KUG72_10650 [Pseudomonadales bacterium]|nr:hypothetical protein [Pseudomonadales bacterium]